MRKRIKKLVKNVMSSISELVSVFVLRKIETLKFMDKRRRKIYSTIKLTKEQKKSIDRLYRDNYGKRVPYIWHRHYTAFTGNFDEKYIPELIYIPEFEYYMTPHKEYCYAFADKNVITMIAECAGVKTPKTVLSKVSGIYRDENLSPLSMDKAARKIAQGGGLFAKPSVESCSGEGCCVIDMKDGMDILTGRSVLQVLADLGENFVIQEIVKCHESIRRLHPESVNTFRVTTYRWKNCIRHFPVYMRIGIGNSYVDNVHAGGITIAVDDSGILHKTAYTEFNIQYTKHPDTDICFEGYMIYNFDKVIQAAERMHYAVPQVGVVNWDFTLDEEGNPVLIEGNMSKGGMWASEETHGKGIFGSDTAEVLSWMKKMRKTKISEREKLYYGGIN